MAARMTMTASMGCSFPDIRLSDPSSTVSQKFCSQKRQGKSLKLRSIFDPLHRDTEIRSTKSEIRNNLKTTMSKIQNKLQPSHVFLFWSFVFRSLEFVSSFGIRISNLENPSHFQFSHELNCQKTTHNFRDIILAGCLKRPCPQVAQKRSDTRRPTIFIRLRRAEE
jgi:hypothetical protein